MELQAVWEKVASPTHTVPASRALEEASWGRYEEFHPEDCLTGGRILNEKPKDENWRTEATVSSKVPAAREE